jgi:hypothetical protein
VEAGGASSGYGQDSKQLAMQEYNEGWIEWSFKHTMTSEEKVFFAFFYPWSNTENDQFLS